jgi:hypothetical protein
VSWVEQKLEHVGAMVALEAERTRDAFAAGLAQTQRGLRVDGAAPRPLPTVSGILYAGGPKRLVGWTARETGGVASVSVDLYDGGDAGAVDPSRLVASLTCPAGMESKYSAMPAGISFGEGLYAVVSGTGTLRGVALIGAVD